MAAAGLTRQVQADFSGGMWRQGRPENIPPNGCFDISNGLLEGAGGVYKRGGSAYRATAFGTGGLRWIWDGWLANGQQTLVASPTAFGKLSGGAVTSLGGSGLTAPARAAVLNGKVYLPGGFTYDGTAVGTAVVVAPFYCVTANRLFAGEGSTVKFSKIGEPDAAFAATDFHRIPGGVEIIGLEAMRQSVAVFTTQGVWMIGGVAKNLTDPNGNVQQTLDLYSNSFILWASGGIASWQGSLIVPSTEGVYLTSLGVTSEKATPFIRISDPIVDLYQEYVRSGYMPGQAVVHRNHYFLPIIGAGEVVDLLVARMDLPMKGGARPWTHLEGAGGRVGVLTSRVVTGTSRTPELIGGLWGAGSRPVTLSWLEPNANTETDHDGSAPAWSVTTRSYTTARLSRALVQRARLRYQLVGGKAGLTASVATETDVPPPGSTAWGSAGAKWGAFAWATPQTRTYEALAGAAPESADAAAPFAWHVRKKRRFVQLRLSQTGRSSTVALRSLELFVRPSGRL